MALQKVTFNNKNKNSDQRQQTILSDINVNELKEKFNKVIDYLNNFTFPVSSVNGMTGDIHFDFPVSSVNGMTGNVILNFPVSSINGKTGNVVLKASDLENDVGYITTNDIPVSSVNGKTGDVHFNFPVSSVNGMTGDVVINFPVSSVNGKTGAVVLKTSDLQNDSKYITTNSIPVSSVNGKTGAVVLKTSNLSNDSGYITIGDVPITSVVVNHNIQLKNKDVLTGKNINMFIPSATSHLQNDNHFYTNLQEFMKEIKSVNELNKAVSGKLYCILQEQI